MLIQQEIKKGWQEHCAFIVWYYILINNYAKAMDAAEQALANVDGISNFSKARIHSSCSVLYRRLGMFEESLKFQQIAYQALQEEGKVGYEALFNIAATLNKLDRNSEALPYLEQYEEHFPQANPASKVAYLELLTVIHQDMGNNDKVMEYAKRFYNVAEEEKMHKQMASAKMYIGDVLMAKQQLAEAFSPLQEAYDHLKTCEDQEDLLHVTKSLVTWYEASGDHKNAFHFLKEQNKVEAKLDDRKTINRAYKVDHQLEMERKEAEHQKELGQARLKTLAHLANQMAHEIQNPLQFVNNFSELNLELLDDLEQDPKDTEAITDLRINCQKIKEHGQRISKIVTELQEKTQKAKAGELELGDVDEHDFSGGDLNR